MALDFAATWNANGPPPPVTSVIVAYEQFKRDFNAEGEAETTEALYRGQGFIFTPMVIDAHGGGMGKDFRTVIDAIGKQAAMVSGLRSDFHSLLITQRISATLQRKKARAVLRRRVELQEDGAAHSMERPSVSP